MSAAEAAHDIGEGRLSAVTLMRWCLERIDARDAVVKAWRAIDREAPFRRREVDKRRLYAAPGVQSGLPFGVKNMIDTVELPTTHNSLVYQDHRPVRDAACVALARHAGAVLPGKTDTVEFASFGRVAATTHPMRRSHRQGPARFGFRSTHAILSKRRIPRK